MNYLSEYTTFKTVKQLNEAIDGHIQRNQYELNNTDREVFLMLGRYAVKYPGASHLKTETIAKAIGKSKRTIQRSLRKLERLGMIERKEFIRKKAGGNGANIYVILPVDVAAEMTGREDDDKPTDISDVKADDTNESINLLSENNTYDSVKERIIHESIRNNTSPTIVELLSPFFYGSELYKYVGIVFKAKYRPHISIRIEEHIDAFKACIYDVIRRFKAGYIRNFDAYLFASIRALARRLYVRSVASL